MSVLQNTTLFGGDDGYQISRSLRFRSSATAYMSRTPASAGSQTTWTWSGWVKRGSLGVVGRLFNAGSAASDQFGFLSGDTFQFMSDTTGQNLVTTQVFRDPSAWYHLVVVLDSTQATAANRAKVYVNGSQITAFGTTTYPAQNSTTLINSATAHNIGRRLQTASEYFDGYLTEVNFIDGQALTPSSFGENDAVTGVWKPKKYLGTYGTNGFYLNFSDNSAATATAIGKDLSGNANNWTPNNISVTSGVTYDSMIDTPTMYADGGNGRGNYCVINPIDGTFPDAKPTNGNLTQSSSTNWNTVRATIGVSSGKWYWETVHSVYNQSICGIANAAWPTTTFYPGYSGTGYSAGFGNAGYKYVAGAAGAVYGSAFNIGDVIGYALDMDGGTLTCYINGVSQGTMVTGLATYAPIFPAIAAANTAVINANFGQRPFAYTPPTGFLALNTQNLPDSTIKKGGSYFNAVTYTGNGATGQTITGAGFQPDLVWVKSRSNAYDNGLQDSVRGATKDLNSNNTDAEETRASSITAFASDGFTLGGNDLVYNGSGATYVGWQWKKGVTQGFDIVTYTGTGANRTVAHSLGVAPSLMILKTRNTIDYWVVWHGTFAGTDYLTLNTTNAKSSAATYFNSTTPTSSVFSLGTDTRTNGSGTTYVAYLFSEVAGYSKFGSYTGNGSADGPFVYLGFKPRFILTKRTDSTSNWVMQDTSRDTYNPNNAGQFANLALADNTGPWFDVVSNGFKVRNAGSDTNTSGGTYIYAAFAENPFKNSLAR